MLSFQYDKGLYNFLRFDTILICHDSEREILRKKYVASLANRTPEQIQEEEALYIEIKRLDQNERQFKRDRENLLRTIAGVDSGLPDIIEDDASLIIADPKKKKLKGIDLDIPQTPVLTAPVMRRPPALNKNAVYGLLFIPLVLLYSILFRYNTLYH